LMLLSYGGLWFNCLHPEHK